MTVLEAQRKQLNLAALRDPSRPVSRIADDLLPYLQVLVDEFAPQQVILFGSYAYGNPDEHSDVDLLIVKDIVQNAYEDAVAIRMRWAPLMKRGKLFSFDLLIEPPEEHEARLRSSGAFYREINERGVSLL
ncbi:MAG: nucleotidyltransferase domain-containing protein [Candidatus Brachytrichaceae bacterium NZ_4S206]|jgi:predicted nucleotidyltransferase